MSAEGWAISVFYLLPAVSFLIYLFWPLIVKQLRPFIFLLRPFIFLLRPFKKSIEKYYPFLFFGLGILILCIIGIINLIDDKKYLEFKEDFYTKNASILKPSNFNEIQELKKNICSSAPLHENSDFDQRIREDLNIGRSSKSYYEELSQRRLSLYIDENICSHNYIIRNIEKNVTAFQIRDDILYRQLKLNYYRKKVKIGLKCVHYNDGGYDGFGHGGSYLRPFSGGMFQESGKYSEYFYNLYKDEYNSLSNFLIEKIKNTELLNNNPQIEKKILEEITKRNTKDNYENKLNMRFWSEKCNSLRDEARRYDLERKKRNEPLAKQLGRAAKSAKDGVQDVINPLKNKADKLFDQFKDGFND